MSIFSNLFNGSKQQTTSPAPVSEETAAPSISLEKHIVNLDKSIDIIAKATGFDFSALKSRVKLVIDYSGSMRCMYVTGKVQEVITRLLPLALKFDDDGELDCYLFSNGCKKMKPVTKDNYTDYVDKELQERNFFMGGTQYAPVLNAIHDEVSLDIPDFIIFITDGDNSDKPATDDIIRKMSTDNCFIMFVGIGGDRFAYLSELDNLSGRLIDNTGFMKCEDLNRISDEQLYAMLLGEYKSWLKR